MKIRRTATVVAMVIGAALITPGVASPRGSADVLAPVSTSAYKELGAKWWQWAASTPYTANGPFGSGVVDCGENQLAGNTWFLAGGFSDPAKFRSCTVPGGKRLFFPVVNVECSTLEYRYTDPNPTTASYPFYGGSVAERRACVNQERFGYTPLFAELDGKPIVLAPDSLMNYSVTSPDFPIRAVDGNAAGIYSWYGPDGEGPYVFGKGKSVSKGVWLLLAPLSPGEHVLHFAGTFPPKPTGSGFRPEATYYLTVLD